MSANSHNPQAFTTNRGKAQKPRGSYNKDCNVPLECLKRTASQPGKISEQTLITQGFSPRHKLPLTLIFIVSSGWRKEKFAA